MEMGCLMVKIPSIGDNGFGVFSTTQKENFHVNFNNFIALRF